MIKLLHLTLRSQLFLRPVNSASTEHVFLQLSNPFSKMAPGVKIALSDSNVKANIHLPGWTLDDFTPGEEWVYYLRTWRILMKLDWCRERSFSTGFLDLPRLEKTSYTYFKCINLERVAPVNEIKSTGYVPYNYGLNVTCELSKVGNTSFQIDHVVSHAETGASFFKSSLVAVIVDKKTRTVSKPPQWWTDKFRPLVAGKDVEALRIGFRDVEPAEDANVSQEPYRVTPLDLDYYGHANNLSYLVYCINGALIAHRRGLFTRVVERRCLEEQIKTMELDFISDCSFGDEVLLESWEDKVDPRIIWARVKKADETIYIQKLLLDLPNCTV